MTPRWTSPLTGSAVYEADAQAQGLETKTGAQVGLFGGVR